MCPGLIVLLPIVGWVGDTWGIPPGRLAVTPVFLVGRIMMIAGAGSVIGQDIARVWTAAAARSEGAVGAASRQQKILSRPQAPASPYGGVRVLFDVDLDVEENSVIALLSTNGARKSRC